MMAFGLVSSGPHCVLQSSSAGLIVVLVSACSWAYSVFSVPHISPWNPPDIWPVHVLVAKPVRPTFYCVTGCNGVQRMKANLPAKV